VKWACLASWAEISQLLLVYPALQALLHRCISSWHTCSKMYMPHESMPAVCAAELGLEELQGQIRETPSS